MKFLIDRMAEASTNETLAGKVFSIVLSMISMAVLSICMTRRVQNVRDWSRYPLVCWLVVVIYFDSLVFVLGTAIISAGYGLIYYFLVERVYIIRRSSIPRIKDPLYLLNSLGMLIPYCVIITLNFTFRSTNYKNGECRIGMKRVAMIPLIAFDIFVNVYLTSLFLVPLQGLYSYKNNPNSQTRAVALRTFVGSCCNLTSSVVNLTLLLVLKGEPAWICLICCNVDILFSILVLHWITSRDNAFTFLPRPSHRPPTNSHTLSHPHSRTCSCPTIRDRTNFFSPISPLSPRACFSRLSIEGIGCGNLRGGLDGMNGCDCGCKRGDLIIGLQAGTATGTVTTTVTAGAGLVTGIRMGIIGSGEMMSHGKREGEEIKKPKMAIMVERDHVREVVEMGVRAVERERESGGGAVVGREDGERYEKKRFESMLLGGVGGENGNEREKQSERENRVSSSDSRDVYTEVYTDIRK